MAYEVHIETWMMDSETADWLATESWWLDSQYEDARTVARQQGQTVATDASVVMTEYTQKNPAQDGGILYDFVYEVTV